MGKGHRTGRLGEEIKKIISELLVRGLKDPRLSAMISVTAVEVTNDGSYATVFLSVLGLNPDEEKAEKQRAKNAEKASAKKAKAVKSGVGSVARTAGGTIGREIGNAIGKSVGGSFGRKLGGNLGASLGRNILGTFFKL
jgi:ribosome-binding factor A